MFSLELRSSHQRERFGVTMESSSASTHLYTFCHLANNENLSYRSDQNTTESQLFYTVLFVGKVRFRVSAREVLDDGCVAFEDQDGSLQAGFILAIQAPHHIKKHPMIHVRRFEIRDPYIVNLEPVDNSPPTIIRCADIIHARLSDRKETFPATKLLEKLSYIQTSDHDFILIRYPNLVESS